jgi:hypothetical protein
MRHLNKFTFDFVFGFLEKNFQIKLNFAYLDLTFLIYYFYNNKMSNFHKELEQLFILAIEKNNLDKVKKFLSSGYTVNSILHSCHSIWV